MNKLIIGLLFFCGLLLCYSCGQEKEPDTNLIFSYQFLELQQDDIEFEVGRIVFNTPHEMEYNETRNIELIISLTHEFDQLRMMLSESGRIQEEEILVNSKTRAVLTSDDFRISTSSPSIQRITKSSDGRWTWKIMPLSHGPNKILTLTVSAVIDDADTQINTYVKNIYVDVTWAMKIHSFIGEHWGWLIMFGVAVVAIIISLSKKGS